MLNLKQNYAAGLNAEQYALNALRKRNIVEDRSSWATDLNKPYAMDFYWPEKKVAADFKYKSLNKKYNCFYLAEEHYQKYCAYVNNSADVEQGYLWYVDRNTKQEYLINIAKVTMLIQQNVVKKQFSKTYKKSWESGYFYCIPVAMFKNITNEDYSIKSLTK